MRRVLVIGSGGAGKTTFSLALAKRTGLPVVHLDAHFWRPGWGQPESEEWADQVDRLAAEPRWIMGFCLYLVAGAFGVGLAAVSSSATSAMVWSCFAFVFVSLGLSLLATVRHRS